MARRRSRSRSRTRRPTHRSFRWDGHTVRRGRFEGHALFTHRAAHKDPSHHIGPCGPECRAGRATHVHREGRHLYSGPGAASARRDFIRRYGAKRGAYIYGATVARVKREQLAARGLARRARLSLRNARRMTRRSR